jgi:DNA-3-methyladenine glycosylase II
MSFDPDTAIKAMRHLRRRDPVLRPVIERVGPVAVKLEKNRFQALVRSIIAQQISGKAARSIWLRLHASVKPRRLTADVIAAIPIEQLRSLGLTPQKASYIHDLAAHVAEGRVRLGRAHRMTDEEVIEELVQVKGIGVWTAQMFLIFSLGRPDVFPHGDYGVRAAIRNLYGLPDLPDKEQSFAIAAPWRPYASIAAWYCWRSLDGAAGL